MISREEECMDEGKRIPPVPEGVARPLWSVMIPVYNRTKHISEAIESVISQDPGPDHMQICLVDNSTESIDWPAILKPETLRRIDLFKQPQSVSTHDNWNTCIRRSQGRLVHILHDDDFVADGFYLRLQDTFAANPDVHFVSSRCFTVDEDGILLNITPRVEGMKTGTQSLKGIYPCNPLRCPGVVVKRLFYERFGGFALPFLWTIDYEMWGRAVSFGKGIVLDDVLAFYREGYRPHHELWRTDAALKDIEACLQQLLRYDPSLDAEQARGWLVHAARRSETEFLKQNDREAAKINRAYWRRNSNLRNSLSFFLEDVWGSLKGRLFRFL